MNNLTTSPNRLEKVFVSDCEGPVSKNDNAFELTKYFVPEGDKFFILVSKYDDVQAEILQKPGYKRGNTLKLILPFLKAYGATDEKIRKYSSENVLLFPGAKKSLKFVENTMRSFLVSTSYKPYIKALCKRTGFPFRNTYYTDLCLDKYVLEEEEMEKLQKMRKKIKDLNRIEVPVAAESLEDFSPESRKTIEELDKVFYEKIPELESGKILEDVDPVGGLEKGKAVEDIRGRTDADFEDIMYVGDSITDVEAFRFLKKNNGLTISFNGNEYAIKNAEIAVLAENTVITSLLACVFNRFGKDKVFELIDNWGRGALRKYCPDKGLLNQVFDLYPERLPQVSRIYEDNLDELIESSCEFRKRVRGETIGGLG